MVGRRQSTAADHFVWCTPCNASDLISRSADDQPSQRMLANQHSPRKCNSSSTRMFTSVCVCACVCPAPECMQHFCFPVIFALNGSINTGDPARRRQQACADRPGLPPRHAPRRAARGQDDALRRHLRVRRARHHHRGGHELPQPLRRSFRQVRKKPDETTDGREGGSEGGREGRFFLIFSSFFPTKSVDHSATVR